MAEVTASIGCYVASGYRRLAGVQLSINHVGPARLGDVVQATATPIQLGRKIQVPSLARIFQAQIQVTLKILVKVSAPQTITYIFLGRSIGRSLAEKKNQIAREATF
jgi:acyl-coenzyme A thioesterase PaaI-like protein